MPLSSIAHRDLFTASHIFTETSSKGDTSAEMAARLPEVIFINILGYDIRDDNTELVQPFKVMYTKAPQRMAISNFRGYNIQLPRVMDMEPDFTDSLYCWCYMLYKSHLEKITVQEVIAMTPELQTYAEQDTGFRQFCDRYSLVSASPETRKEYVLWVLSKMREAGMLAAAIEKSEQGRREAEQRIQEVEQERQEAEQRIQEAEQGRQEAEQGRQEAEQGRQKAEKSLLVAVGILKAAGKPSGEIADLLGLTVEEVEQL